METTGTGDSYLGAYLYCVINKLKLDINALDKKTMDEYITFVNAAASICVQKKGAIPALPRLDDIIGFLKKRNIELSIIDKKA